MPSLSSVRILSTCCLLVSGFFTEIVQHIHSLRARGVRSSHIASASASDARIFRTSSGKSWTTPPEISFVVIYKLALSRKDCRSSRRLQFACLLPSQIVARQDRALALLAHGGQVASSAKASVFSPPSIRVRFSAEPPIILCKNCGMSQVKGGDHARRTTPGSLDRIDADFGPGRVV